jgi:hypothetical protein
MLIAFKMLSTGLANTGEYAPGDTGEAQSLKSAQKVDINKEETSRRVCGVQTDSSFQPILVEQACQ